LAKYITTAGLNVFTCRRRKCPVSAARQLSDVLFGKCIRVLSRKRTRSHPGAISILKLASIARAINGKLYNLDITGAMRFRMQAPQNKRESFRSACAACLNYGRALKMHNISLPVSSYPCIPLTVFFRDVLVSERNSPLPSVAPRSPAFLAEYLPRRHFLRLYA